MTWTITTHDQMQQALEQLSRLYAALAALRREVEPQNPRNFSILAEGHVEDIRRLQRELDRYVGVVETRRQVPRRSRRKASERTKRRG